ncbi:LysR family transcriptional regulator [Pseudochrobactrum sp. MP213Fo]|uniref:LysR family transcriptional regulator n=1 Tax=Pseudochrobactrum sp. MP213Fo TaxID=3022250 RepID=UPI003BA3C97E
MAINPEFELTQSFLVVAEELSFRRGAERLHIDQSALTRRIQKLENYLGFTLFERTTREVSVTPAGRVFYEENARLLQSYERSVAAAKQVADGKTGKLRVAYMAFAATELMPRAVARYRRLYPHINVGLRYVRSQGQKLALMHDEIDVGYMIGPFDHSEFNTITLADDPLYVVTPRNHPLTRQHLITPADIPHHDLILGDMEEWEAFRWRLNDLFADAGVPLNVTIEASNTLALIGLVAAGLGITIYPESLIGYLGQSVESRPLIHPDFRIQTVLAWKRSNRSKSVGQFIEVAKNLTVN